jgi:LysR family positive regulator for ilvC
VESVDLRDLKMFLHLAESRHFGRSARDARQPSTLSRQIQRLEEDLGQPLFVRDNRTVTLTEAGKSCAFLPSRRCCSISSCATPSISRPSLSGEAAYLLLRHRRLQPSAADPRPLPRRASVG